MDLLNTKPKPDEFIKTLKSQNPKEILILSPDDKRLDQLKKKYQYVVLVK